MNVFWLKKLTKQRFCCISFFLFFFFFSISGKGGKGDEGKGGKGGTSKQKFQFATETFAIATSFCDTFFCFQGKGEDDYGKGGKGGQGGAGMGGRGGGKGKNAKTNNKIKKIE